MGNSLATRVARLTLLHTRHTTLYFTVFGKWGLLVYYRSVIHTRLTVHMCNLHITKTLVSCLRVAAHSSWSFRAECLLTLGICRIRQCSSDTRQALPNTILLMLLYGWGSFCRIILQLPILYSELYSNYCVCLVIITVLIFTSKYKAFRIPGDAMLSTSSSCPLQHPCLPSFPCLLRSSLDVP